MRHVVVGGLAALLASACGVGETGEARVQASGQRGQRDFQVGAFRSIELRGIHDVVFTTGATPGVRAEGDTAALEGLEISVENGRLIVGTRRGWSWNGPDGAVTVAVTAPTLEGAAISGTGDMRIDRVETPRFAGSVSGTGDMEIGTLQAREVDFSLAGTGTITARGRAEQAALSLTGPGDLALGGLEVARANVSLMGPGDVAINAREQVSGSLMGPGDIVVSGGARCTISRSGPGDVRCG